MEETSRKPAFWRIHEGEEVTQNIPTDTVPPAPPTREQILWANNALGKGVRFVVPGAVLEDPDGVPTHVAPSTVYEMPLMNPLQYTRAQLVAAGVDPEEVPNVNIVD